MSEKSEEQIILRLILKGQSESDIIDYLEKRDLIDRFSIYRIQSKIREMKTAQAFLPYTPTFFDRLSSVLFGVFLIVAGGLLSVFSLKGFNIGLDIYIRSAYGFWIGIGIGIFGIGTIVKGIQRMRWD